MSQAHLNSIRAVGGTANAEPAIATTPAAPICRKRHVSITARTPESNLVFAVFKTKHAESYRSSHQSRRSQADRQKLRDGDDHKLLQMSHYHAGHDLFH